MTPRMLLTGRSTNFCPAPAGAGTAATGVGETVAAGCGDAAAPEARFCRSFAVMEPSNPEPRETEAKLRPFSAASLRAKGEAKIRSVEAALIAGAEGAIMNKIIMM